MSGKGMKMCSILQCLPKCKIICRIRKEIEEFKEQHQRTNQEREKEFTELESELSQLETQKFENLSIIKQHAQCKIQV